LGEWVQRRDFSSGFILSTTDGGRTWRQQYTDGEQIGDLDFVNSQVGWALMLPPSADQGTTALLGTTDGGKSWQQIQAGEPFTRIDFISPTTGWAVDQGDGKLLKTEDGGRSWTEVSSPPIARSTAVCFADADHGWLASGNAVFRTVDGGQDWTATETLSVTVNLVDLQCAGQDVAWALFFGGAGGMHVDYVLYRTADAGVNWTPLLQQSHFETLPGQPGPGSEPGPLAAVDANTAYFVGTRPACNEIGTADVESTTDGGADWTAPFTLPGVTEASDMSCPDAEHCWVAGSGPNSTTRLGAIAVTADGGKTWSAQFP
jgi:photosystem II stability/assembly factor-like uncharacterized protein